MHRVFIATKKCVLAPSNAFWIQHRHMRPFERINDNVVVNAATLNCFWSENAATQQEKQQQMRKN